MRYAIGVKSIAFRPNTPRLGSCAGPGSGAQRRTPMHPVAPRGAQRRTGKEGSPARRREPSASTLHGPSVEPTLHVRARVRGAQRRTGKAGAQKGAPREHSPWPERRADATRARKGPRARPSHAPSLRSPRLRRRTPPASRARSL